MTDLEKFKQLFTTCSFFRGGGHQMSEDGVLPTFQFDIAVKCKNGKTEYVVLTAHFNDAGEWIETVKTPKPKHAPRRVKGW